MAESHSPASETNPMARITVPFDRFAPRYDRGHYSAADALGFALASHVAYFRRNWALDHLEAWGFTKTEYVNIERGRDIDTQAFVAGDDTRILIAFRGSESRADWLTNLQAATDPGPLPGTRVHQGFQNALYPAMLTVYRTLRDMQDKGQTVWLTGHSLGGALAVLAAAMLCDNGVEVSGVYTYGAPRTGNGAFARELDLHLCDERGRGRPHPRAFRVVNAPDLVPHVPPEPLFSHSGQRVLLQDDGTVSHEQGAWVKAKQLFASWFNDIGDGDLVIKNGHLLDSTDGYIRKLMELSERE